MHYTSLKVLLLFLFLIALTSCLESTQGDVEGDVLLLDSLVLTTPPRLSFVEVIPQELTDSAKTEIINRLVHEIDEDTSMVMIEVPDSLNRALFAFYRNDSLVKVRWGLNGPREFLGNERRLLLSGRVKQYYFHSDSLIYREYYCSSWQQTGRCNPVSISVFSWFYERKLISQEIDDNIGYYDGCGCGFVYDVFTYDKKLDELLELIKNAAFKAEAEEQLPRD